MTKTMLAGLTAAMLLSGCATVRESRLNPFNWFGGPESTATEGLTPVSLTPVDGRPKVQAVTGLSADRMPDGAIITALGTPTSQGWWETDLLPLPRTADMPADTLVLEFRAWPPITTTRVGSQPSREVSAAIFLSNQDLAGIRRIVVQGVENQVTISR
ncbi:MAG: hypothetical protein CL812_09565 [Confluentimicrobium sp.]|nr:hypothetical protein [Actibacterium sp.]|tara:strand:- start:19 stop:492 length:474 start_codon:yes stop_codon:yes gene_type:complete